MKSIVRWPKTLEFAGYSCVAMAVALLLPLSVAFYLGDNGLRPILFSIFSALALGGLLIGFFRGPVIEFGHREAIIMVLLAWLTVIGLGALPFYFSNSFGGLTDATFESASGFTTTGATILKNVESLPGSLLLWRSFTHWLGGMGIILLGIAVLPLIGTGGMELYRAEFAGSISEKLKPRIAETAWSLWSIYASLTLACILALFLAGMTPFDAVAHAFSTMGTGGFSTRNSSIESFESATIEGVIILFMFLAGLNFTLQYRLFLQRRLQRFLGDRELRVFAGIIAISTIFITVSLTNVLAIPWVTAFRSALFQVVSIQTGTGFSSSDFAQWPPFAQLLLLVLMCIGGCTGSTTGGLKISRLDMLWQVIRREFHRMVERRGIFSIHMNGKAVSEHTIQGMLNLVYLALVIHFVSCLLLTAFGVDVFTSVSAVTASIFNIGPGLGQIGPAGNYSGFTAPVKWVLIFDMVAGRLEFYVFLVVLSRSFWRK
jgi:trk system potassium uptake protein TrkH